MANLSLKIVFLDSLVCSEDSLILETANLRTHKPKIVNESLKSVVVQVSYRHIST